MALKARVLLMTLYVVATTAGAIAYRQTVSRFGDNWHLYALLLLLSLGFAALGSLAIEFAVTVPLQTLRRRIAMSWAAHKTLPDTTGLPRDLAELERSFQIIWDESRRTADAFGDIKKLDEAKYEFVSIASHQIRTPLTELRWVMNALTEEREISAHQQLVDLVQKAKQSLEHIASIVDQFLAVINLSENDPQAEESVDAAFAIRTIIARIQPDLSARRMTIRLEANDDLVARVVGKREPLEFVFGSILENALKYGNEGSEIVVELRNDRNSFEARIADTGIALSPHDQALIFERFFRSSEAKRRRPDGSGLAMYLSKRIVERFGGSMRFDTTGPMTTFSVRLPVESEGQMQRFVQNY